MERDTFYVRTQRNVNLAVKHRSCATDSSAFSRTFFPHIFPARFPALYAVLLVLGLNSDSLLVLISSALIGLCDDFGRSFTTFIESKSAPMYNHVNVFLPTVINLHTNRCVRTIGKVR